MWPARRRQLPRYVERGGEQVHAHPLAVKSCEVHAFPLPCSREHLERLCARDFTAPSGGRVRIEPVGDRALVVLAELGRITSTDAVDRHKGWTPEIDVAVWVPVVRVRRVAGRRWVRAFGWYLPWILVDRAWAVLAGREAFGLPKQVATITAERDGEGLRALHVSTDVLGRHAPDTEVAHRPLLELQRAGAHEVAARTPASWLRGLSGGVLPRDAAGRALAPGVGLLAQVGQALLTRCVPMYTLKQFRDLQTPQRACYQAVVEATCRAGRIHAHGPVAHRYRLGVHAHDSHRLAAELGLGEGALDVPLEPGWRVVFDFEFLGGRELWRA